MMAPEGKTNGTPLFKWARSVLGGTVNGVMLFAKNR